MNLQGFWLDRWKMQRYTPGYLLPPGSGRLTDHDRAPLRLAAYVNDASVLMIDDEE